MTSFIDQANQRDENREEDDKDIAKGVGSGNAVDPPIFDNAGPVGKQENVSKNNGNVPNLEKKLKNAIYLPVSGSNGDEVWKDVTEVMKDIEKTDVNIDSKKMTAYGLKYFADTFAFARTRLCNVDGELHIELRKLDGDGFTYTDVYKNQLKQKLEQGGVTKKKESEAVKLEETKEDGDMMYLDLTGEEGTAMINYWKKKIVPDARLEYNKTDLYDALSSLGWNCSHPKNFEVLKKHENDLVGPVLAVLDAVDYLPTLYNAALTLEKFFSVGCFGGKTTWSTIETLCSVVVNYSAPEDSEQTVNPQDMKRSRQLVKLIGNCLKSIEPKIKGKMSNKTAKLIKKIRDKDLSESFGKTFWSDDVLKLVEGHTGEGSKKKSDK